MRIQVALAGSLGVLASPAIRADLTKSLIAYSNSDLAVSTTIPDQLGQGRDGTLFYAWNQGPGGHEQRQLWGWTQPEDLAPYFDGGGKWSQNVALQGTSLRPQTGLGGQVGRGF